jgi:hypothetical protein
VYLFPFVNIILAKWHYQYLCGVYLGAYIKDEVIIVQNKKSLRKNAAHRASEAL